MTSAGLYESWLWYRIVNFVRTPQWYVPQVRRHLPSLQLRLLNVELGQQALFPTGEVGVRPHPRLVKSVQKYDHGSSEIPFRLFPYN